VGNITCRQVRLVIKKNSGHSPAIYHTEKIRMLLKVKHFLLKFNRFIDEVFLATEINYNCKLCKATKNSIIDSLKLVI